MPGDVHSALIAAKIIPDPYIGRNEYDARWVAEEEWIASRNFQWDGGAGNWHLDIDISIRLLKSASMAKKF